MIDKDFLEGGTPEFDNNISLTTPFDQTDKIASMSRQSNGGYSGLGYFISEEDDEDAIPFNTTDDNSNVNDDNTNDDEQKITGIKVTKPSIFNVKNKKVVSSFHSLVKELNNAEDESDLLAVLHAFINAVDLKKIGDDEFVDLISDMVDKYKM